MNPLQCHGSRSRHGVCRSRARCSERWQMQCSEGTALHSDAEICRNAEDAKGRTVGPTARRRQLIVRTPLSLRCACMICAGDAACERQKSTAVQICRCICSRSFPLCRCAHPSRTDRIDTLTRHESLQSSQRRRGIALPRSGSIAAHRLPSSPSELIE